MSFFRKGGHTFPLCYSSSLFPLHLRQSHLWVRWWKSASYWAHQINAWSAWSQTTPQKTAFNPGPAGGQFPLPKPASRKGTCHFRLADGQLKESRAVAGGCGLPIKWIRLMSYLYGWCLPRVGKVRRLYSAALWSCAEIQPIYTLSQATIMRVTRLHVCH